MGGKGFLVDGCLNRGLGAKEEDLEKKEQMGQDGWIGFEGGMGIKN